MPNPEAVYRILKDNAPAALCDDCLASAAKVHPRQQVNIIARSLGLTRDFQRRDGICATCGDEKLVTRSVS